MTTTTAAPRPAFERVLGRVDLLLFTVTAILTVDTLASAASMGVSWFAWWAITVVFFFVPYGFITAELGASWPAEGGLYVWVREGLGPRWGSMAAWLYWINNAYYIPQLGLVFAGTFARLFLPQTNAFVETAIAVGVIWFAVGLGVLRLRVSKWVPSIGAVVKISIFAALGGLGIASLVMGRPPANELSAALLVPRWSNSLEFLPVLLYNALGFELMSSAGEEMKDPQRDVPRVILLSGLGITAMYVLGVGGMLLAVPTAELSRVTGIYDSLVVLARPWGAAADALVFVLAVAFLYACIANVVTWSLGSNRMASAAAEEGALPRALGRLHPQYQTPYIAFLVMGVISTVLLLGNAAVAGPEGNPFWMIFKLSSLCFLLCYLLVFPAFLVLRHRQPDHPRPYRMPGGPAFAWTAAVICWLFVAGACVLFFKPAPDAKSPVFEGALLAVETLVTLAVGAAFMPRRAARP